MNYHSLEPNLEYIKIYPKEYNIVELQYKHILHYRHNNKEYIIDNERIQKKLEKKSIENDSFVIRIFDNKITEVFSKYFVPLQKSTILNILDRYLPNSYKLVNKNYDIYRDQLWLEYIDTDPMFKEGEISHRLFILNKNDAKTSFRLIHGFTINTCLNAVISQKVFKMRTVHKADKNKVIKNIIGLIYKAVGYRYETYEKHKELYEKSKLTDISIRDGIDYINNTSNRYSKKIIDKVTNRFIHNEQKTVLGLSNAFSYTGTHLTNSQNISYNLRREAYNVIEYFLN